MLCVHKGCFKGKTRSKVCQVILTFLVMFLMCVFFFFFLSNVTLRYLNSYTVSILSLLIKISTFELTLDLEKHTALVLLMFKLRQTAQAIQPHLPYLY